MKNKDFARLMLSGNTSPSGKQNQSVNIVSMLIDNVLCASYFYHSSLIVSLENNKLTIQWCGFYTVSTARHINHALNAVGSLHKVSAGFDKRLNIKQRDYIKQNNIWKQSRIVYNDGRIEVIQE